jgi:hypothetical protein
VKPTNYALSLYDLKFLGDWSYQGTLKIDLEVKKAAKEILLNLNQLVVHSAELTTEQTKTQQSLKSSNVSYDKTNQRVTLAFDQEFAPASKAVLEIKFQGTMNNVSISFQI